MLQSACSTSQSSLAMGCCRPLFRPGWSASEDHVQPKTELRQRPVLAWQQRVLSTTEEIRSTMQGLGDADACLKAKTFRSLPEDHHGLMRCSLNGTQYTNDPLCHVGVVASDACRFCGCRDCLFHRTRECPCFQDLRNALPELPTACHGWLPRAPELT